MYEENLKFEERRRADRVRVDIPAQIKVANGNSITNKTAQISDISIDGAFVSTDLPIDIGAKINLTINELEKGFSSLFSFFTEGDSAFQLNIDGEVVRRQEASRTASRSGVGIHFTSVAMFTPVTA